MKIMIEVEVEDATGSSDDRAHGNLSRQWDVIDAVYHVPGVTSVVAMKFVETPRLTVLQRFEEGRLVGDWQTDEPTRRTERIAQR